MIGHLGILPGALTQGEVAVLAAPDVQLMDYQIRCDMRKQLRRLLGLYNAGTGAVLGKRGEEIVQRVDSVAYALGRIELHDEKRAGKLGAEVERDGDEAVEQLPDTLKIIFRVREFAEAFLVVLLRLCDDVVEDAALALEHRIKNRTRNVRRGAYLIDADIIIALGLEQPYGAFCNALLEPVCRILHEKHPFGDVLILWTFYVICPCMSTLGQYCSQIFCSFFVSYTKTHVNLLTIFNKKVGLSMKMTSDTYTALLYQEAWKAHDKRRKDRKARQRDH